jgi:dTDP-4-amino-4,6-dideoxygalactose transaminase
MIPFVDLKPMHLPIWHDIETAVRRVMTSGVFLNGDECAAFEEEYARYTNMRFAVGCANGRDAITMGLYPNPREQTYQANSCIFTKVGIERFHEATEVDVDESGFPVEPVSVPVLLYGVYQDVGWVADCVDAAQAGGWKPGRESANVAWSFFPTKCLGCFGDGGMMTTNDESQAKYARGLRDSLHSRLAEVQAAILRVKLPHLDSWNAERERLAEVYYDNLSSGIQAICPTYQKSTHHIFGIVTEQRDELMAHLWKSGVGCKTHYPDPLAELPGARWWCDRQLSLPMWVGMSDRDVVTVCDTIRVF